MDLELTLQIIINLVAGGLVIIAIWRVPAGRLRLVFILFVLAMLCWLNPLLVMRRPDFDLAYAALVARFIFCTGLATLVAFGFFLVMLFGRDDHLLGRVFWIFQANNILLVGFTISGLVVVDFDHSSTGQIVPNYGPLHGYFILSWSAFGGYLFWLGATTWRRTTDEFTRFQIGHVFWTSLVTFVAIILTNAVLPRLTGVSSLSHLGPLSTLVVFGGILRLLIQGRKLVVDRAVGHLLSLSAFRVDSNIAELRRLIDGLMVFFEKNPPKLRQNFEFQDSRGALNLRLERPGSHERLRGLSPGWLSGFLDSVRGLETENRRLAFALMRAEGLLGEQQPVKELVEPTLQLPPGELSPADYRERISVHLAEIQEVFGQRVFAMTSSAFRQMIRLRDAQPRLEPALFTGETGSGKALLARCLHHTRLGGNLTELSCEFETAEELRHSIRNFLEDCKAQPQPPGLLLRHIDSLSASDVGLLEPLLRLERGYVYLTASAGFATGTHTYPDSIQSGLAGCLLFETIPLRERPDDLNAFAFSEILKGEPEMRLTPQLLARLQGRLWPGNFRELARTMQGLLSSRSDQMLLEESLLLALPEPAEILPEGLSPLEDSERRVIIKYLKKNAYNKSRTNRELGITLNTLKAKIDKYGIALPGRGE